MSDLSLADLADSVDYGGVTTAEALQTAFDAGFGQGFDAGWGSAMEGYLG